MAQSTWLQAWSSSFSASSMFSAFLACPLVRCRFHLACLPSSGAQLCPPASLSALTHRQKQQQQQGSEHGASAQAQGRRMGLRSRSGRKIMLPGKSEEPEASLASGAAERSLRVGKKRDEGGSRLGGAAAALGAGSDKSSEKEMETDRSLEEHGEGEGMRTRAMNGGDAGRGMRRKRRLGECSASDGETTGWSDASTVAAARACPPAAADALVSSNRDSGMAAGSEATEYRRKAVPSLEEWEGNFRCSFCSALSSGVTGVPGNASQSKVRRMEALASAFAALQIPASHSLAHFYSAIFPSLVLPPRFARLSLLPDSNTWPPI